MNRLRPLLVFALPWMAIILLTWRIFVPGLDGGFIFDDNPNLVENRAIHITTLDFDSLKASISGPEAGPLGRPVSVLSFALTHYFYGLDPVAFKTINLALHIANGLLIAWLTSLLLQFSVFSKLSVTAKTWLPHWVAAVWLLHPVNVIPVLLSVQRMTLLAGCFTLLALIAHTKAVLAQPDQKWRKFAALLLAWLAFWPLAALSKESGLLFPLYAVAVAMLAHGLPGSVHRRRALLIVAPTLVALAGGLAMMVFIGSDWLQTAYGMRPFTMTERLLTEARVLWFYLSQIILPNPAQFSLHLDDIAISKNLLSPPTTLLSVAGWVCVLIAIAARGKHFPVAAFAMSWFLLGHTLESTFLPLEIAHEYRNYLPSFAPLLALGYLGASLLQKAKLDYRKITITLCALVPVLVLALFTWMRSDLLGSPLRGAQIEAIRHPQSARANYAAASALIKAKFGDKSDTLGGQQIRFYLDQSLVADPGFKFGSLALIIWACASDRPLEMAWVDNFAIQLEQTPFSPRDLELPDHILKALLNQPGCLERRDALRLFEAGAANVKIKKSLQSRFLESAFDYELLISVDLHSAHAFLLRAAALSPGNPGRQEKLKNLETAIFAAGRQARKQQ